MDSEILTDKAIPHSFSTYRLDTKHFFVTYILFRLCIDFSKDGLLENVTKTKRTSTIYFEILLDEAIPHSFSIYRFSTKHLFVTYIVFRLCIDFSNNGHF